MGSRRRYEPRNKNLAYLVTVVGSGGRPEDFRKSLNVDRLIGVVGGESAEHHIYLGTSKHLYYAWEKGNRVELDLYKSITSKSGTETREFKKRFGHVLTLLLKTGFNISQKLNDRLISRMEKKPIPKHDF